MVVLQYLDGFFGVFPLLSVRASVAQSSERALSPLISWVQIQAVGDDL
jgi:hypothetical protein